MPKRPPTHLKPEIELEPRPQGDSTQDYLREFFYDPEEEGDEPALLPVLLPEVEREKADAAPQPLDELLCFRLDAEDYAIEIGEVHEIIRPTSITEVPRSSKAILGVISLRGEALPVFDLQRLLGTAPKGRVSESPRSARVVILTTAKGLAGILVDSVDQVVRLPHGSIEATPRGLAASPAGAMLKGIGRWQGRLLAILDPVELLHPDRRR